MTKTATEASIPPELFATQAQVLASECVQVAEQLNYTAQKVTRSHFSTTCGAGSWYGGDEGPALGFVFYELAARACLEFVAVLDEDVDSFTVGARCVLGASKEATVFVEWEPFDGPGDPGIDTIDFTDSDNGTEKTIEITPEYKGAIRFWISIQMNVGTPDDGDMLYSFRLEDSQLATLPDPPDE